MICWLISNFQDRGGVGVQEKQKIGILDWKIGVCFVWITHETKVRWWETSWDKDANKKKTLFLIKERAVFGRGQLRFRPYIFTPCTHKITLTIPPRRMLIYAFIFLCCIALHICKLYTNNPNKYNYKLKKKWLDIIMFFLSSFFDFS